MKKAIFHSNLGGWGGIPCLGSKLWGQNKKQKYAEKQAYNKLTFHQKIWNFNRPIFFDEYFCVASKMKIHVFEIGIADIDSNFEWQCLYLYGRRI